MSLKVVHFMVFLITSLMGFVCAAVMYNHSQTGNEDYKNYGWFALGFLIAAILLLIYSFWYLQHAKKIKA